MCGYDSATTIIIYFVCGLVILGLGLIVALIWAFVDAVH